MIVPYWNKTIKLHGYMERLPKAPQISQLEQILHLVFNSKKYIMYVGGGCLNASQELKEFVDHIGILVASTLMGLGYFPSSHEKSLGMLGMHGTVYANYAVDKADLLLSFGVHFDDRVTDKLESFASCASLGSEDLSSTQ
jgi:acetolactate synthase-1/2/3 large subunit